MHKQMLWMIEQILGARAQVARDDRKRRRRDAISHLQRQGGSDRIRSAAESTDAARNGNRVGRLAVLQDQFVPAKERDTRPRVERFTLIEINHGAQGERARNATDLVKIETAKAGTFRQAFYRARRFGFGEVNGAAPRCERVGLAAAPQGGLSARVKFYGEVFEVHFRPVTNVAMWESWR